MNRKTGSSMIWGGVSSRGATGEKKDGMANNRLTRVNGIIFRGRAIPEPAAASTEALGTGGRRADWGGETTGVSIKSLGELEPSKIADRNCQEAPNRGDESKNFPKEASEGWRFENGCYGDFKFGRRFDMVGSFLIRKQGKSAQEGKGRILERLLKQQNH